MDATIYIHTYKEGLLSKLAHDLRLTMTRFEISARGTEVTATFEPRSLRVDGAMKDGRLNREQLSANDREKILDNVQRDVLRAGEFPSIAFVGRTNSREPPFAISGELTLLGVTKPFSLILTQRRERLVGEAELIPSEWGVKPFRALGGTLRVQDRVLVRIDAGGEWLQHGGELNPAVQLVWQPAPSKPTNVRSREANR